MPVASLASMYAKHKRSFSRCHGLCILATRNLDTRNDLGSSSGDIQLGGEDFDCKLVDFCLQEIKQ